VGSPDQSDEFVAAAPLLRQTRRAVEELQAVGARVHLAEPAETAARRGTKPPDHQQLTQVPRVGAIALGALVGCGPARPRVPTGSARWLLSWHRTVLTALAGRHVSGGWRVRG
jgi:hypothetical protein